MVDALVAAWDARIARARHLAAGSAHGREILDFYRDLAEQQRSLAARVRRPREEAPDFADAVDLEAASAAAPGLLDWLRRQGPPRLAQGAATIDRVSVREWRERLRQRLVADDGEPPEPEVLTAFAVEAVLQPFAEAAAVLRRGRRRQGAGARTAVCPVCGSRPSVGALREEGHGARRTLVCGLCLTEWDYARVVCPSCDEERFDALPVYTADSLPHARLEACDSCRTYLKTIDLTKDGLAVPVVDDLASVPLDLWAREHGYHRLRPNLLRL
jgi:FdhE protein